MNNVLTSFIKILYFVLNSAAWKNTLSSFPGAENFSKTRPAIFSKFQKSAFGKKLTCSIWQILLIILSTVVKNLVKKKKIPKIFFPGTLPIPLITFQGAESYLQTKCYMLFNYFLRSHFQQIGEHSLFPSESQHHEYFFPKLQ